MPAVPEVEVKVAGPADVEGIAVSMARAFADDPVFEFLLPGMEPAVRAERAVGFFAADARQSVRKAAAWTTPARTGAALWSPPGQWRVGIGDGIRLALPLLRASRGRVVRGLSALNGVERAHPRQPHWYLNALGTDPDHQGTGIGSALLAPVLARCDEQGLPAYLESSKASNVPYYERFGFDVQRELRIAPKLDGPTFWLMWREPG